MARTYKFIDDQTVINTAKKYGNSGFSVTITVPPLWVGKKVVAKLAPEEEHTPEKPRSETQA